MVPSNETTSGALSIFSSFGAEHEMVSEMAMKNNAIFFIKNLK